MAEFKPRYTEADYDAALAAIATKGNGSWRSVVGKNRGLPGCSAIYWMCSRDSTFNARFREALAARDARPCFRKTRFSEADCDAALVAIATKGKGKWVSVVGKNNGLPDFGTIYRMCSRNAAFNARFQEALAARAARLSFRNTTRFSDAEIRRALDWMRDNPTAPITELGTESAPGLPWYQTLHRRAKRDPQFARALAAVLGDRERHRASLRPKVPPKSVYQTGLHRRSLSQNEIYRKADQCVPRSFPPEIREDAIIDIVVAVLERKIACTDICDVASEFIRSHLNRNGFYDTSLDAVIASTDGLTRMDFLSTTEWSFEDAA